MALELVLMQEREGLLDDIAELAKYLMLGARLLQEITDRMISAWVGNRSRRPATKWRARGDWPWVRSNCADVVAP